MSDILKWDFYNPTHICFGLNFPHDLSGHLPKGKMLFVTSPGSTKRGITQTVLSLCTEADCRVLDVTSSNPSFNDLRRVSKELADFRPDFILAIGGGSVLDLAKILSYAFAQSADSVEKLIEQLKKGEKVKVLNPLPFIAVPTTAGTGSEVTPFATIWDDENKKKYSLGTDNLFPLKALLFPSLTVTLPWSVTLSTGLDALSQCLESVWNKNYTPLTAAIAAQGVRLAMTALPILKNKPDDLVARAQMLEASLLSGLCISRTRTAMAHAISYPLTAHFGTPHGIACSFTLVDLWDHNLVADDGRMARLSQAVGIDKALFSVELLNLLKKLNFAQEFQQTVHTTESVVKLSHEMYNPARAENNLRSFDNKSLDELLKKATKRWL